MQSTYLSVVHTDPKRGTLMHDAARPHAVVLVRKSTGAILRALSRHETYGGACIACGKRIAQEAKQ